MKKELFDVIGSAEVIYISLRCYNISSYIKAPAQCYYDEKNDTLLLGDEDNGILIRNANDFKLSYNEFYNDCTLIDDGCEILIKS